VARPSVPAAGPCSGQQRHAGSNSTGFAAALNHAQTLAWAINRVAKEKPRHEKPPEIGRVSNFRGSVHMAGLFCSVLPGAADDQAVAGPVGVAGADGVRAPRAKRVASILRRSSTPCPLPVTLSTA
jgi:hypothetical protein